MLWLTELGGLIFIGSRRRHPSSGATGAIHHVSQPLAPLLSAWSESARVRRGLTLCFVSRTPASALSCMGVGVRGWGLHALCLRVDGIIGIWFFRSIHSSRYRRTPEISNRCCTRIKLKKKKKVSSALGGRVMTFNPRWSQISGCCHDCLWLCTPANS